jgi:hypothetical protein
MFVHIIELVIHDILLKMNSWDGAVTLGGCFYKFMQYIIDNYI